MNACDKIREDDWVCVNLDSFNDQQTLYCLYVNANGIQLDAIYAANNEDVLMTQPQGSIKNQATHWVSITTLNKGIWITR